MRRAFPLFQSHLDLAHSSWSHIVTTGDSVIDATCGNGYDAFLLCQLALSPHAGAVYCLDNQKEAISATTHYLNTNLQPQLLERLTIQQRCHSTFPETILTGTIKLIVYNLGYLPGGDKKWTTKAETTLKSLQEAQKLLQPGGVISVTCYPGHSAGAVEQQAIIEFVTALSNHEWSCSHHVWLNRKEAPSLIFMQKAF